MIARNMIKGKHYQIRFGWDQSLVVKCTGWAVKRDRNNAEYTVYLVKILMSTAKDARYHSGKDISIAADDIYYKNVLVIPL